MQAVVAVHHTYLEKQEVQAVQVVVVLVQMV
jgi:hypothetical protein